MDGDSRAVRYAATAEAADPYCLSDGEAAALLAGHPWRRFAVLGDSVASGVGDPTDGYTPLPWADRVAAELTASAPELAYLNLGRRNLRAAAVRAGQLDEAVAFRPDLALIACGANDALHPGYDEAAAAAVDDELAAMVEALRRCGADVVTFAILVLEAYPSVGPHFRPSVIARMRRLGERTTALARRLGTIHIDLATHPAGADDDVYSADGLHGNGRSHAICAAGAVRALGAHLDNHFPPRP
jgi:lysophospholipase L1-like esterase